MGEERGPAFTPRELLALADALWATVADRPDARTVWIEVDDALRHGDLAAKWGIDGAALLVRLRDELTAAQRLALADGITAAWAALTADPRPCLCAALAAAIPPPLRADTPSCTLDP